MVFIMRERTGAFSWPLRASGLSKLFHQSQFGPDSSSEEKTKARIRTHSAPWNQPPAIHDEVKDQMSCGVWGRVTSPGPWAETVHEYINM